MIGFSLGTVSFLLLCVLVITNRISEKTYVAKLLLYIDVFVCAAVLGDGDMTISARCGLALINGGGVFLRGLGRALNVLQKDHTTLAIANDIKRAERAIGQLRGQIPALKL